MSFSSIAAMLSAAQTNGQPLHAVIRDADCQENGYDAAASHRQIAALWTAMQQSSRQYCAADRSNSGLIGGDAARELPEMGELDALVVDPPRAGLADGVVASIAAASPRRVAYVSCDASTWARDVARFEEEGYRLIRVTPVDLFPQTYHVEVVSIFERSGS